MRLVLPWDAVEVEQLGALELDPVGETRRLCAAIGLESGGLPHSGEASNGPGRPWTAVTA